MILGASADRYPAPIISGHNLRGEAAWSVLLDDKKCIFYTASDREELFDLRADTDEQSPLVGGHAQTRTACSTALESHRHMAQEVLSESGLVGGNSEEFSDRLRSLGYIQ